MDVRSPAEFNGEIIAPPGMTETAQRAGHIPGAASIPWAQTVKEDGTFKDADELRALYEAKGITPDKDVIAYCRIGERSSPHLVRAPRAARLRAGPQLRRLLDRVRQPHRRADREAGRGRGRRLGGMVEPSARDRTGGPRRNAAPTMTPSWRTVAARPPGRGSPGWAAPGAGSNRPRSAQAGRHQQTARRSPRSHPARRAAVPGARRGTGWATTRPSRPGRKGAALVGSPRRM